MYRACRPFQLVKFQLRVFSAGVFSAKRTIGVIGLDIYLIPFIILKEKVDRATEIQKAYPGYEVIFGVFSNSGFTQPMIDVAKENAGLHLIDDNHLV